MSAYPDRLPSLMHAIGDRSGGRVRLYPVRGMVYRFVSCEHPQEFVDALHYCCGPAHWIETDDGTFLQLAHVVEVDIVPDLSRQPPRAATSGERGNT